MVAWEASAGTRRQQVAQPARRLAPIQTHRNVWPQSAIFKAVIAQDVIKFPIQLLGGAVAVARSNHTGERDFLLQKLKFVLRPCMAQYRHFFVLAQTNNMVCKPDGKGGLARATGKETPHHNQLGMGQRLARPEEKPVMKLVSDTIKQRQGNSARQLHKKQLPLFEVRGSSSSAAGTGPQAPGLPCFPRSRERARPRKGRADPWLQGSRFRHRVRPSSVLAKS